MSVSVPSFRCDLPLEALLHRHGLNRNADITLPPIEEDEDVDGINCTGGQAGDSESHPGGVGGGATLGSSSGRNARAPTRAASIHDSSRSNSRSSSQSRSSSHGHGHVHDPAIQTLSLISAKPLCLERCVCGGGGGVCTGLALGCTLVPGP